MNPQHIVYIGLVLVGLSVTICAIDPLKPVQYIWAEVDIPVKGNFYLDIKKTVEMNESIYDMKYENGKWYFKIIADKKSQHKEFNVTIVDDSRQNLERTI